MSGAREDHRSSQCPSTTLVSGHLRTYARHTPRRAGAAAASAGGAEGGRGRGRRAHIAGHTTFECICVDQPEALPAHQMSAHERRMPRVSVPRPTSGRRNTSREPSANCVRSTTREATS
eukprot:scaffold19168_cov107-Isochrysis_galbana.AAC.12